MAGANGLKVRTATNCLEKLNGKPVPFWNWNRSTQLRWLVSRPHDFIANEGGIFDWHTAPLPQSDQMLERLDINIPAPPSVGIAYIITIRNPLDRVLSHFRHEKSSRPPKDYLKGIGSFSAFIRNKAFCHWKVSLSTELPGLSQHYFICYYSQRCNVLVTRAMQNGLIHFELMLRSFYRVVQFLHSCSWWLRLEL